MKITDILSELRAACTEAETIDPPDSTPNRTAWLRKQATEDAIAFAASKIADALCRRAVLQNKYVHTLSASELRACIDGIRQASLRKSSVWSKLERWVLEVELTTCDTAVRDTITKLFLHLRAKEIVNRSSLKTRNIRVPTLAGPFSDNLSHFVPSVDEFDAMTQAITQDPFLRSRVYPAAIMLGSQLKGYGIGDADADVAVFIKPDVSMSDQVQLNTALANVFSHERIGGSVLLFWLEDSPDGLVVRENTQTTTAPTLPTWAHVLLGGAWVGELQAVKYLRHQLLTPYLYESSEVIDDAPARFRWLEELERDAILYRLLHKGYERFYPIESPFNTLHGDAIDGASAFYDPRFRRIATELFLSRVFLPNLGTRPTQ